MASTRVSKILLGIDISIDAANYVMGIAKKEGTGLIAITALRLPSGANSNPLTVVPPRSMANISKPPGIKEAPLHDETCRLDITVHIRVKFHASYGYAQVF